MFEMKYDRDGNPIKAPSTAGRDIEKPSIEQQQLQNEQEVSASEVEATAPETQDNSPQAVTSPEPAQQQVSQSPDPKQSFKELRSQKEKVERERDELFRRLQEIEYQKQLAAASKQSQPNVDPNSAPEDLEVALGPDDIAEGKHLTKVQKHIKKLEDQIKQFHHQSATLTTEAKLRAQYPDFDTIVTKDNIDVLRDSYPELAQTLNSSNDLYAKAASAYTLIKKLGIYQNPAQYAQDVERAKANAAKPRPLTSISPQQGDTPLSRANAFANGELTEDVKAQLLKEMYAARRNM